MNPTEFDEFEEHLKQLAISAQQHPPLTAIRQIALRKLINKILRSGKLCHPQRGQFSGRYKDIYDEAVQDLLLYICRNIDKYDATRGSVMAWVNMLLERRFFREAIPKVLGQRDVSRISLSELENFDLTPPEATASLTDILKESIELDPENLFKQVHIRNHPGINFQALAQRRLTGMAWEEISAEFGVKVSTVSSFYYRCLDKFSTKLKEYCTALN